MMLIIKLQQREAFDNALPASSRELSVKARYLSSIREFRFHRLPVYIAGNLADDN
jgi:hypothetical protein